MHIGSPFALNGAASVGSFTLASHIEGHLLKHRSCLNAAHSHLCASDALDLPTSLSQRKVRVSDFAMMSRLGMRDVGKALLVCYVGHLRICMLQHMLMDQAVMNRLVAEALPGM